MAEFAPAFDQGSGSILPKNTTVLPNRLVKNALNATTIGAAAGGATTVNKTRVKGRTSTEKDLQPLEVEALINRNSTAADVTEMKRVYTRKKPSFAFVADRSGNGGRAFTRS